MQSHDLRDLCWRCHRFEPMTGLTFCAACGLDMLEVAQRDQALAKINSEVEENPELGVG